jgi:isopenicillin N synthase-like dioxygenase
MALDHTRSPTTAGYAPVGGQSLDSQDADAEVGPPDLKEGFYYGMDLPDDDPLAQLRIRDLGHNLWPDGLPGFREQMVAYRAALNGLADRLLQMLALSLDLDADWFAPLYDKPSIGVRLLRYPPQPEISEFNQLGAGAHTDWSGITLLAQDDLGGLEVRNAAGDWVAAPPVAGSFVVNLGDLMARWTNGVYSSNMHRVKNVATDRDRYSVPCFCAPRHDAVIAPVPTCVGVGQPARFPVCTTTEHMMEMFLRSYGKAAE